MPGSGASRAASAVAALAVVAGVGTLSTATGSPRSAVVAAIAGGLLGGAVIVRARETPVATAVASLLTPVVGVLVVAGVGLSLFDAGVAAMASGGSSADLGGVARSGLLQLGVGIGAWLGAFGAVGTLRDGVGDGGVGKLWRSVLATLAVVVIAFGAILAPRYEALSALPVPGIDLSPVLDPVLSPGDPGTALLTFWVLAVALARVARMALGSLPIVELAARSRKERAASLVDRIDRILRRAARIGLLFGLASLPLLLADVRADAFEAAPATRDVVALLATPALRSVLLALIAVLGGIALAVYGLRRVAGRVTGTARAYLPAALGGVFAFALAVLATPLVGELRARLPGGLRDPADALIEAFSPTGVVLAALAVAIFALWLALTAVVAAGALGYVPSRAAGGAFAAAGLVVGAVSVGATGGPALVVFVVVALGILAWDASEHGVTTRAELAETRATGVEAVHAVGSLGVAVLGVALAWVTDVTLLDAIAVPDGSLAGALGAILASILLLGILRG